MTPLAGLLPDGIASALGLAPAFRGRQVFRWIHRGIESFAGMSDLPAALRSSLDSRADILTSRVDSRSESEDGSVKLRIRLHDGAAIEAMSLQDGRGRRTACLSTQAGCGMGCAFCRTGLMGLVRDLAAHEIVEELLHLRRETGDVGTIVFMGMGEPLLNPGPVAAAVGVFAHSDGPGMSLRRTTISTCGIVEGIRRLAEEGPAVRLAVSLVSAVPGTRAALMPVSRANPLPALREALGFYQERTRRRVTLEVVLIDGVTDRAEDAEALVEWAASLGVMVNLIPWNPVTEIAFRESPPQRVRWFKERLEAARVPVTERLRKGRGVNGACGQLAVIEG
ncbi:MAG: 23S rRNA (adenine(2503)-C(2))-methyltransferase RlmN [Spirochaetes bacterium]|nr:23S rRNA (adenine(2503)-C(2))-methyltransferase RlmN [Spirochaetota bacterium]